MSSRGAAQNNESLVQESGSSVQTEMAEDHGFTAIADFQIQDENGSMTQPVDE